MARPRDELRGKPLSADDWQRLVQAMAGQGLEDLRIAHVKPQGLERIWYCEIYGERSRPDCPGVR